MIFIFVGNKYKIAFPCCLPEVCHYYQQEIIRYSKLDEWGLFDVAFSAVRYYRGVLMFLVLVIFTLRDDDYWVLVTLSFLSFYTKLK